MTDQIVSAIEETQSQVKESKDFFASQLAEKSQEIQTLSSKVEGNVSDYTFVKDELNKTKDEVQKLQAQLKSMPPINVPSKTEEKSIFLNKEEKQDLNDSRKTNIILSFGKGAFLDPLNRQKVYNDNTDVLGARVSSEGLYTTLYEGNLARMFGTVMQVNAGTFKLPNISAITYTAEANVNASRTNQGGIGAGTVNIIDTLVAQAQMSLSSMQDIDNMDSVIMNAFMMGASRKEGQDCVTALDSATITEVNSGVATGLPPSSGANNIIVKLNDMVAGLSSAYLSPNCRWYMSRGAFARASASNNTTLNYDPVTRVSTILGFPVYVSDHLDAGTSANDLPIYFGDLSKGLFFATRSNVTIERFYETSPGFVTYFSYLRSKSVVWDTSALVRMKISA